MAGGAWLPDDRKRNVIPRWRDFQRTLQLGELSPVQKHRLTAQEINLVFHNHKIADWNTERSVRHTIELLNSSLVLGDEENIIKTAKQIESDGLAAKPLKDVSARLLYADDNNSSKDELPDYERFDKIIGGKINHFRSCLKHNPLNSICWIELARLFLIIGKEEVAKRCILVATQLAPHNRYISRIGSRFFTHTGDYKKAKQILKANMAFKNDPWLLSADIGISSLDNKSSFNIKHGRELITSKNYSPFDLNELLSALATEELNSGSVKNSKKLFNQSLINPNDNALAQAVWAKTHISGLALDQITFEKTPNVYEAKANQFFYDKSWGPAFSCTIQWFVDQPFSRDPAAFGSFIACSLLEKYDDAIKICKYGLKATPTDFTLLNNLAFAYLKKGDIKSAQPILNRINSDSLDDQQRVVYLATKGLHFYKLGIIEAGEALYKEASNLAGKIKNYKLQLLADFHHLAVQLEMQEQEDKLFKLDRLVNELKSLDLVYLNELVKNLFKRLENMRKSGADNKTGS